MRESIRRTRFRDRSGQSLIEFALAIPFLLLLIANVVNFGGLFFSTITIANAARHGSQFAALGSSSVGISDVPSALQVHTLLTNDTGALVKLNPTSLGVRVCSENKVDATAHFCTTYGPITTYPTPPLDTRAEAPLYTMAWVDLEYTYQPYIKMFTLLGVPTTTPTQTFQRQSVMRILQ